MQYTTTELKWLENLVERAANETSGTIKQMEVSHPLRTQMEQNRINMMSLYKKIHKDIEHRNRSAR